MCKECEEIVNIKDYKDESPWARLSCIVYDTNTNKYHLWVECADWYYSGIAFHDINNCPYCGRKLK